MEGNPYLRHLGSVIVLLLFSAIEFLHFVEPDCGLFQSKNKGII